MGINISRRRRLALVWHRCVRCLIIALLAAGVAVSVQAREFRAIAEISQPGALPAGAAPVKKVRPVSRATVQKVVERLMASWNTTDLARYLGKDFYDKQLLLDSIDSFVPRDARIRILSIQGIQTLQQWKQPHPREPSTALLVSRVSVTVRTQVEFNDPNAGFQSRIGTNDYVLKIKQRVRR